MRRAFGIAAIVGALAALAALGRRVTRPDVEIPPSV
jgi:hypothetical protein